MSANWRTVYNDLKIILDAYGKNDPLGGGDYWLVDDDWGERQQKICVFNPLILRKTLLEEIQLLLKQKAADWIVIIVLEKPGLPADGLIISQLGTKETWDLVTLRKLLGQGFFAVE